MELWGVTSGEWGNDRPHPSNTETGRLVIIIIKDMTTATCRPLHYSGASVIIVTVVHTVGAQQYILYIPTETFFDGG